MSDDTNEDVNMMNNETCTDTVEESTSSVSAINDDGLLLLQYTPLPLSDIEKSMKVYAKIEQKVTLTWEEESCKYEETENVELHDKPSVKQRPRRNYANPEGIVTDPTLFPYHTCCYPLLQAYDGLYHEDDDDDNDDDDDDDDDEAQSQHELQPIESNAILPASFPRVADDGGGSTNNNNNYAIVLSRHDASIPGFMPVSVTSISAVFWNKAPTASTIIFDALNRAPLGQLMLNQALTKLLDSYSTQTISRDEEQQEESASSSSSTSLWNTTAGRHLLESGQWQSIAAANCSPAVFPTADQGLRRGILLKILKHAMSELSRDHGLAAVVLTQLLEHRDFDDLDCLQETLIIMASEAVACGRPCEHDEDDEDDNLPDHNCQDYVMAGSALMFLVAHGMTCMTQEHATALSGFVLHLVMREFGQLFGSKVDNEEEEEEKEQDDETEQVVKTSRTSSRAAAVERQLNIQIKRSIVANRSMNDDDGDFGLLSDSNSKPVPAFFLSRIILGLGLRGAAERTRLRALLQSAPPVDTDTVGQQRHEKLFAQSLDSYYNCLRAQVAIAETVSSTLPSSERFFDLSSAIVFSITGTLILDPTSFHSNSDENNRGRAFYVGQWPEYQSMRVSAPFRLVDHIKNSTALMQQKMQPNLTMSTMPTTTSRLERLRQAAMVVCEGRPHDDIRDAVRMLFLRDLVDVRVSRLGYLDFLLWCRFEVDLNDPVHFWHEFNLPCEEDESDDEDEDDANEDDDNGPNKWDCDEDGQLLSSEELEARFDFSLFGLVCEWNKPWTPESHLSFHPPFRGAVQTLALSLHRRNLPGEFVRNIAQFLPRDAWPDKRKRCWNYRCVAEQDVKELLAHHGIAESSSLTTAKTEASVACKCRVAFYCSKGCRDEDYKAGHKKLCGRPPFCIPGKQEMRFCELIASGGVLGDETMANQEESAAAKDSHEEEDIDDDDDDGSWESIDSDDDMEDEEDETNTNHLTSQILQFFEKYNDT